MLGRGEFFFFFFCIIVYFIIRITDYKKDVAIFYAVYRAILFYSNRCMSCMCVMMRWYI